MKPPSHDFYSAVAQLIPLLLIAAAVEEGNRPNKKSGSRGKGGSQHEADSALDASTLLVAVFGEIAALAGLAGNGGKATAAWTVLGVLAVALCVIYQIGRRFIDTDHGRRVELRTRGVLMLAFAAPAFAALIYSTRLLLS